MRNLAIYRAGRAALLIGMAQALAAAAFAQSAPVRRIDTWSGLIVQCRSDEKLKLPAAVCSGIVARAASQAAAGKVKFLVLPAGEPAPAKTAKAKTAGFNDASAIELLIDIRGADGKIGTDKTGTGEVSIDAWSRLHIMPSRPGQQTQYAKIFSQSGMFPRDTANWQQSIAPPAKRFLDAFFKVYLAPQGPAEK